MHGHMTDGFILALIPRVAHHEAARGKVKFS
jgi:hypothetical protein